MPVAADVRCGARVSMAHPELVNLYGCVIGADTSIGPFVEIQKDVSIGDRCKISSHAFICSGVTIGHEVFVGHGVIFINDRQPRAAVKGRRATEADWRLERTRIEDGVAIGSGAVIMCGITIAAGAVIGAGAVVTRSIEPRQVVVGVPARVRLRAAARA